MGRTLDTKCPGCGGPLTRAHRIGYGAKCRTDGCPAQKIYIDEKRNIIGILFSTEPKSSPISLDELRIMNEVIIA